MSKYLRYHIRWQLSTIVMLAVMWPLEQAGLPLLVNLPIGQFFGALIFWPIDNWILNPKKEKK